MMDDLKKMLCLMLAFVMLILTMAGCGEGMPAADTGGDTADTADTNVLTDDSTEAYNPFADPENAFTVVIAQTETDRYRAYAEQLVEKVTDETGTPMMGIATDYVGTGATEAVTNNRFEILIGDTNRAESVRGGSPEDGFIIRTDGNKIVINGSDVDQVVLGIKYFGEYLIGNKEDGTLFDITPNTEIRERLPASAAIYLELGDGLSDVLTPTRVMTLSAGTDKSGGKTLTSMQGGCTDGRYFYFLITDGQDNENDQTRVVKVDPETMTTVKRGPIISVAHANDITYDSRNNRFVISWCSVDNKKVSFVDPDTLDVTGIGTITNHTVGCFGIAYDAINDRYACAESNYKVNGYGLLELDAELVCVERLPGGGEGHVAQGIDCDSEYIYYAQSPGGGKNYNVIKVYDWDGKLVRTFTVALTSEIENVFWYNGSFYAGFNDNGRKIYKLSLSFN